MPEPRIFRVPYGDAMPQFKESDHPRDKDGKFTSGGSGGGATAKPAYSGPYVPNNNLKASALMAGFKKAKPENGMPTFIHPSGLKVIVHPTPGQKGSSLWALHKGEEKHEGKGGEKLSTLLKKLSHSVAPTPAPAPATAAPAASGKAAEVAALAEGLGLKQIGTTVEGWLEWSKLDGTTIAYKAETDQWEFSTSDESTEHDEHYEKGHGIESLTKTLKQYGVGGGSFVEAPKEAAKASGAGKFLSDKGYTVLESGPKSDIYQKGNAKVEFFPETEEWVAITPPHMPKEGVGLSNLQQLMSGSPAVIPPGGSAPWKNTQKTIMTQSEKEGQAKIAAQAAVANQWAEEHKKKYQAVIAAAPKPTGPQQVAIRKYSGSSYQSMNDALRHNPEIAKNSEDIKNLDAYLNEATFPVDITLERGVKGDYAKILKSIIHPGGTFVDRGYSSTSGRIGGGWQGLKLRIDCKAGSKGASIKQWSQHSSEDEILLPRNAIFKVVKMESDMVHLEYQGVANL